ncbi:MAG: hypothetical protein KKB20_13200 [Proteobacteria bacterium]|nr:hypothetical protein [Pseudomonadota bacterium]
MSVGGFAGQVLFVDLSKGRTRVEPLDPALAEQYIGGLGLSLKLVKDYIRPGLDALDPDAVVVLGAGPLVGTGLPSTSRVYSICKLPTSGTIGWCGAGGFNFGAMLKYAGFDHVVITGRAEKPVYLEIVDDRVELRGAEDLWGLSVDAAYEVLCQRLGRPAGVMSIGPAGENRVAYSMAFIDRISTLGRGGFGAVMGSKNLKAVAVKGGGGVRVADRKRYRELAAGLMEKIGSWPHLKEAQTAGLIKSFPVISPEDYRRMKKRRAACVSCPIGCKDVIEVPDGEFAGLVKCTSSVINLYTPLLYGIQDYRESIRCMATLDEYGLDAFEFFGIMTFVRTLIEEGIVTPDRSEPEVRLDSLALVEAWVERISRRQGLGDVLAGGFRKIIETFGPDAARFAPALVKGMHPYAGPGSALAWDLFGTMELGQVLDPRGPHVGSGGSPTYFARRPLEAFPGHLQRMGVPEEAIKRILPGEDLKVGALLRYSHAWFTILGSLGACARANINRFYNADLCARLYEAVTGIETDLAALRHRVDRVWTLYRMMNLREGFQRSVEEALPERWFREAGFKDYVTGQALSLAEASGMIEDYYDEWGWDKQTGVPSAEELGRLGLADTA